MRRSTLTLGLLVATFIAAVGMQPSIFGQETAKQPAKETKETPKEGDEEKEPVKRLPAHYKDVVTDDQRTKIYALQEQYNAQIAVLADQIKKLQADRAAAIEALLSAEQKKKVADLKAAAAAKVKEVKPKEDPKPATPPVDVKPVAPKVETTPAVTKPVPAKVDPKPAPAATKK